MRSRLSVFLLVVVLALALAGTGCTKQPETPQETPGETEEVKYPEKPVT